MLDPEVFGFLVIQVEKMLVLSPYYRLQIHHLTKLELSLPNSNPSQEKQSSRMILNVTRTVITSYQNPEVGK